jgi:atypical dual specificity phosphatase
MDIDSPELELKNMDCEELDIIINKLILDKNYIIKNKKKLIMIAFYMKEKNMTPYEAMCDLNIKIESDKIMFLKKYQCFIKNKIRKNKKPVLKYGLILLMGPPCSGKSTFSNNLLTAFGSDIVLHINQDELGKSECERLFSENAKKLNKIIILDRCNLKKDDRNDWITSYKQLSNRKILGLMFDYNIDTCKNRMTDRENHSMKNYNLLDDIFKIKNNPINEPSKEEFDEFKIIQDDMSLQQVYKIFELYILGLKKFVRTRHLINLGGVGRDDLLYNKNEIETFLNNNYVVIEEKIDGANLGIFIENNEIIIQNRSHFITPSYHPQFKMIGEWLTDNQEDIRNIIKNNNWILYGEWLYAKHSIHYTKLPDYFVLFDIYDRDIDEFLSRNKVEELIKQTKINLIRKIDEGYFKNTDLSKIENLAYSDSIYYDGPVEGLYLRIFDDNNEYLKERSKIVRHDFIQEGSDHWTHNKITVNKKVT